MRTPFSQFSEKLVDSVGNFLSKLAQTCRKVGDPLRVVILHYLM